MQNLISTDDKGDYLVGYKMEKVENKFVVGCPVYEKGDQLIAMITQYTMDQVTFLHNCRPETCPFEESVECIVKKEGKRVSITKPVYFCNKSTNREYILNCYSFYNIGKPDMDRI